MTRASNELHMHARTLHTHTVALKERTTLVKAHVRTYIPFPFFCVFYTFIIRRLKFDP